jgi:hypothetical protein
MTTTAGHSFYIGPIGSFYYQVNDTASGVFMISLEVSTECFSLILIIEFQPLFLSKKS